MGCSFKQGCQVSIDERRLNEGAERDTQEEVRWKGVPGKGQEQCQWRGPGRTPPGTLQEQEGGHHAQRDIAPGGWGRRRGASEIMGAPPAGPCEPLKGEP